MRILLTGASGFMGRHIASALCAAGHTVVGVARRPPSTDVAHACQVWRQVDFATVESPEQWLPWLADVDVVINAVGIVSEEPGSAGFERLHHRAPALLFEACLRAGVKRVIHVSALGADASATSRYHLSKRAGDEALLARRAEGLDGVVLQPSLVFGMGGASTQLFLQWAAWPRLLVPQGAGPVQPVHVDDLSACVLQLVERTGGGEVTDPVIPVVGPEPLAWEEYLQRLRASMGLPRAPVWRVPRTCVDVAAAVGERLHSRLLTRETWAMLQRGNTAPMARPSWPCRPAERFLSIGDQAAARLMARLPPALALLRVSLALVWIVTAIVSFGLFPVADSLALLARAGVPDAWAPAMLYGAAAVDLSLGVATLARPGKALWWAQIGLISLYTGIISWKLPEFWLHPYGPVLKNLPILAALSLLIALEPARPTR